MWAKALVFILALARKLRLSNKNHQPNNNMVDITKRKNVENTIKIHVRPLDKSI